MSHCPSSRLRLLVDATAKLVLVGDLEARDALAMPGLAQDMW